MVNYSYVLGSFSSLIRVRISMCKYFRATAMRVRSKVKAVGVYKRQMVKTSQILKHKVIKIPYPTNPRRTELGTLEVLSIIS